MNKHDKRVAKEFLSMKRCRYCHSTENLTIDHKLAIIKGGSDNIKNLQCLCRDCNSSKSALSDGEVKNVWKWFIRVQKSRLNHGKRALFDKLLISTLPL